MFKDIFVRILQERNISAYKLSKDTGIAQGMISYWKTGARTPSAESLNILADYLGCSVDYLLGRDEQQKKPAPTDGDGLDPELVELIKRIPADRMPEVERYLRFQAGQEEKP